MEVSFYHLIISLSASIYARKSISEKVKYANVAKSSVFVSVVVDIAFEFALYNTVMGIVNQLYDHMLQEFEDDT